MASASELVVLFKGDTSGLDKAAGESKGMISGLVDGLGKLGLAGMGFGVLKDAAGSLVGALGDTIGAAEGLDDAIARSDAVFGSASAALVQHAGEQANALGMTKEAYMAAAGGMGNLLTNMGVGKEKAAEMSGGLADLAPKLAAFAGVDTDKAMAAMEKGLTGATKGLKEMGIVIPDIPKGLDDAAKAAFIYDNVLKQSGDAQAAWAGNSGDVENSMARVSAAMTDAKAAIGEKLLPILAPLAEKFAGLASGLVGQVGPAIETASAFIEDLVGNLAFLVFPELDLGGLTVFEQFGAIIEQITPEIEDLIGNLAFLVFPDMDLGGLTVMEQLTTIAGAAFDQLKTVLAGIDWQGIGQSVMTFAGYFKDGLMVVLPIVAAIFKDVLWPVLQTVFGFLMEHKEILVIVGAAFLALSGPIGLVVVALTAIGAIVPMIKEWWASLGADTTAAWDGIGATISGAWESIKTFINDTLAAIGDFFTAAWDGYVALIQAELDAIQAIIIGIWNLIPEDIRVRLELIGTLLLAKWTEYKETITTALETVRVFVSAKWDAIKEYLSGVLASIGKTVSDAWEAVTKTIDSAMQSARDLINAAWQAIGDLIQNALAKVHEIVSNALDWIEQKTGASMDGVRMIWDSAMTFISGLVDTAVAFLTGHWGDAFELLKSTASDAWENIKAIFSRALENLKQILNIDGLVANFKTGMAKLEAVGGDLIEGLKRGISKGWDTLKAWMTGLFGDLITLAKKILGIASPSKVMADEVGQPIAMGIVEGIRMTLKANPLGELVHEWATKQGPSYVAQLITPLIGAALGAAITMAIQQSAAPELVNSDGTRHIVGVNARVANGRDGLMKGAGIADKPSDDRVRADAFRSGKGGLLAASSSNYWQIFVSKWGVPTESSARKVAAQLGIPLPQWLLDIYNPPGGSTVDRPDVLKDPEAAIEAGTALKQLAKVTGDATAALEKVITTFNLVLDPKKFGPPGGGVPLPPGGGIGGPIPIPGPGGSTTSGGGYGGITDATINAQAVTLRGPVSIGMNATLEVGGGRSLVATLVSAIITDTANFDKLIEAEDRRRAQKS